MNVRLSVKVQTWSKVFVGSMRVWIVANDDDDDGDGDDNDDDDDDDEGGEEVPEDDEITVKANADKTKRWKWFIY